MDFYSPLGCPLLGPDFIPFSQYTGPFSPYVPASPQIAPPFYYDANGNFFISLYETGFFTQGSVARFFIATGRNDCFFLWTKGANDLSCISATVATETGAVHLDVNGSSIFSPNDNAFILTGIPGAEVTATLQPYLVAGMTRFAFTPSPDGTPISPDSFHALLNLDLDAVEINGVNYGIPFMFGAIFDQNGNVSIRMENWSANNQLFFLSASAAVFEYALAPLQRYSISTTIYDNAGHGTTTYCLGQNAMACQCGIELLYIAPPPGFMPSPQQQLAATSVILDTPPNPAAAGAPACQEDTAP